MSEQPQQSQQPFDKYYAILGVDKCNTSVEEIKSKYREYARTGHPDKGGDPDVWQAITTARNEILENHAEWVKHCKDAKTKVKPPTDNGSDSKPFVSPSLPKISKSYLAVLIITMISIAVISGILSRVGYPKKIIIPVAIISLVISSYLEWVLLQSSSETQPGTGLATVESQQQHFKEELLPQLLRTMYAGVFVLLMLVILNWAFGLPRFVVIIGIVGIVCILIWTLWKIYGHKVLGLFKKEVKQPSQQPKEVEPKQEKEFRFPPWLGILIGFVVLYVVFSTFLQIVTFGFQKIPYVQFNLTAFLLAFALSPIFLLYYYPDFVTETLGTIKEHTTTVLMPLILLGLVIVLIKYMNVSKLTGNTRLVVIAVLVVLAVYFGYYYYFGLALAAIKKYVLDPINYYFNALLNQLPKKVEKPKKKDILPFDFYDRGINHCDTRGGHRDVGGCKTFAKKSCVRYIGEDHVQPCADILYENCLKPMPIGADADECFSLARSKCEQRLQECKNNYEKCKVEQKEYPGSLLKCTTCGDLERCTDMLSQQCKKQVGCWTPFLGFLKNQTEYNYADVWHTLKKNNITTRAQLKESTAPMKQWPYFVGKQESEKHREIQNAIMEAKKKA